MAKRSAIVIFLFVGLGCIWMGGCQTQEQKVERLIKQLGHKKAEVRYHAAMTLGNIGTPESIKVAHLEALKKRLNRKTGVFLGLITGVG